MMCIGVVYVAVGVNIDAICAIGEVNGANCGLVLGVGIELNCGIAIMFGMNSICVTALSMGLDCGAGFCGAD